ncbi:efflux RND transporter permease subunit [Shewanella waksmanii]|uniref:efflux RND transporter permease subunit n=1 Tax=Shewanella waksmanii TaxID=213783 RepID=UPI0037366346
MQTSSISRHTGLISYFAKNTVAANLLMLFIAIIGLLSYFSIKQQLFPDQAPSKVRVAVSLPGASAKEVEELILIKIEEAVKGVSEIDKVISTAMHGSGRVSIKLDRRANPDRALDKVKAQIDSVASFPLNMEPVLVTLDRSIQNVMEISLVGNIPLTQLKVAGQEVKDELLRLEQVTLVELLGPEEEIAIEIPPYKLKEFELSIDDISEAIVQHSANISAGLIKSDQGDLAIRAVNQSYYPHEFASIPVKYGDDGGKVLLGELANISEDDVNGGSYLTFSGKNAVSLIINATEEQSITTVADTVKHYVSQKNASLPSGLVLETLVDYTYYLDARLQMMLSNLLQGACLVAILLTLFLRLKLALWVMAGLPICFLGAVMLMPLFGLSINIITLFAFIMVLGIVVDDAIVTAESVYTEVNSKGAGIENVIFGVKKVATPATFGVLTTMTVFVPFVFSSGPDSALFYGIAMVTILCLAFSLVESKLILPAHLANLTPVNSCQSPWREKFDKRLYGFINGTFRTLISRCVDHKWLTIVFFFAILFVSTALITSSRVKFVANPSIPHDFPIISIQMTNDSTVGDTIDTLKAIEQHIIQIDQKTEEEYGQKMIRDILALNDGRTEARLVVPLVDDIIRPYDTFELSKRWRQSMPSLPGIKAITIQDDLNASSDDGDFGYRLYGKDIKQLQSAALTLINELKAQQGFIDINSSIDMAGREIQMTLKPVASDLGLSLKSVATQIGFSFYGNEAQRIMLNKEEKRVIVRYPLSTRQQIAWLQYAVVKTPDGDDVMLGDIAQLELVPGSSKIRREQGLRNVYVWGSVNASIVSPDRAVSIIESAILPMVKQQFPGVTTELGGNIQEQKSQLNEQLIFLIAGLIGVYILLAAPLKSYSQPFIILLVIPLSYTGAIWGHYLFGIHLSTMSIFGLIAAAGVVINDALVMIDYINHARGKGLTIRQATIEAGCKRFRPILLTSLTTFAGVLPLMFESSLQAKLIVPMAVSLGCSILFATLVSLLVVPSLYMLIGDLGHFRSRLVNWFSVSSIHFMRLKRI